MKKLFGIIILLLLGFVLISCEDTSPTEGVIYRASTDGTYAEVVGYEGTETRVRIATDYEGLPVKAIFREAFKANATVASVVIPNGVTTIGSSAFADCDSLVEVTIGADVTSIGFEAFYHCNNLGSVVIPDSVTAVGTHAFRECYKLSSVVIGNGATAIGYQAFADCYALQSLVIGESMRAIGEEAFKYCRSLASVVIPDSVTSIGYQAFAGCLNLSDITVGKNNSNYKSIDGNLYSKDGTTLIQYAVGKTETNFTLPDGVTRIDGFAFWYCSDLKSIVIGKGLVRIGASAFSACDSLSEVYYGGSEEDFSLINIGIYNDYLTEAAIHYNYSPEQ